LTIDEIILIFNNANRLRSYLNTKIKKKEETEDAPFANMQLISHCRAVPKQAKSLSINNTVICFSYYCICFTVKIYLLSTFYDKLKYKIMDLSDNITGKIIVITGASSGLGETSASSSI
jgi:hypothetical protein